ncbi:proline and serine-rich protein 3 [Salarias fasciatus]|uniref:proline and serine-rich protein 3 n=1 Tax=Salarias fasciatus TaxID=181472 RepID=UPI0011764D25|nr:proline and serine-rich protein 3 [Salarias fasciatus]
MKSSVLTRRNPFPSSSKKTHQYHQPLSKKDRNTTRSPVRSNQRSRSSPERQLLDEKHDHYIPAVDGSSLYTESWPSSDCGSPPGSKTTPHKQYESALQGESEASEQEIHQQDSVLAKYIERFRHGRPRSREQRQQMASAAADEPASFWWLSPSSLPSSSTPTKITDVFPCEEDDDDPVIFSPAAQRRHDRSLSPCRGSLGGLSDTSLGDLDDIEIQHLQERASRHLLRGECLGEGSVPVSSEGLGSSDFSPPVTVDEPVRRPLIPSLIKQTTVQERLNSIHGASSQKPVGHSFPAATRPEEDILFQWRLRRKMEQARDWTQPPQSSSFLHPSLGRPSPGSLLPPGSGQAYKHESQSAQLLQPSHPRVTAPQPETKEAPKPSPPPAFVVCDSSVPQHHGVAHVPAHMHLLCDVLPCPVQTARSGQSFSQTTNRPESDVQKKTQMKDKSVNTLPSVPSSKYMPSPHFSASGAAEGDGYCNQTVPVRDQERKPETKQSKRATVCSTQQKKSARSSSHQKLSKRATLQKEGSQEIPSESCSDEQKPPPSPIHSALGQVVSEVFFSVSDSPPASSVSPPCTVPARPQASVPPGSAQNSVEVISQLLQEAEDSDEKEFEDDPLLQVLRKQRKWIKEQISEVDSLLMETLEEQQVT